MGTVDLEIAKHFCATKGELEYLLGWIPNHNTIIKAEVKVITESLK